MDQLTFFDDEPTTECLPLPEGPQECVESALDAIHAIEDMAKSGSLPATRALACYKIIREQLDGAIAWCRENF